MKDLEAQREKIERERERVKIKEKILKEKEKRRQVRRFTEVGRIAAKAKIESIEDRVLLGAFLDISERLEQNSCLDSWKRKAENFLNESPKNQCEPLCITFKEEPSLETKKRLRKLNFKWNKFRKEFYGYGERENLVLELEGLDCHIEVVC